MVTGIQEIEQVPENPLLNIEYIISAGRDKTIRIFSCQTGGQLKMFVGHDNWVRDLAFHHSNKYLYSCSDDKTVRVWDLAQGKQSSKFAAHDHFVSSVTSHPTYLVLGTASVDSSLRIWECK